MNAHRKIPQGIRFLISKYHEGKPKHILDQLLLSLTYVVLDKRWTDDGQTMDDDGRRWTDDGQTIMV